MHSEVKFKAVILIVSTALLGLWAPVYAGTTTSASDQAVRDKVANYLRQRFSVAESAKIDVTPLRASIYPGFEITTVTVEEGKNKASQQYYISKDGSYLIQGTIFGLNSDPRQEVEHLIHTQDEPSAGPASAPVTIVEYADLECPMCAEMQQFIEKQLLPRYGNKVRVVFKEFPLFSIHPWAVEAAVADECAYQLEPAKFLAYRSLIFENQKAIQKDTAGQQLLDFGAQAGLDREKLSACISSKGSLPHVREDFVEGEKLNVASTPTFFINGKFVPGGVTADQFFKLVDQALAEAARK